MNIRNISDCRHIKQETKLWIELGHSISITVISDCNQSQTKHWSATLAIIPYGLYLPLFQDQPGRRFHQYLIFSYINGKIGSVSFFLTVNGTGEDPPPDLIDYGPAWPVR